MSILKDKIDLWIVQGVDFLTKIDDGDTLGNAYTKIYLDDRRFEEACLDAMKEDGFIKDSEDLEQMEKEISRIVKEEREQAGIKIRKEEDGNGDSKETPGIA